MKIIDLLNKIANGEEVPKRIKVYSKWYDKEVIYFLTDTDFCWQDWYMNEEDNTDYGLFENNSVSLNDEVEIIEENRIPEKLKDIIKDDCIEAPNNFILMDKINEIIDYLEENK